MPHSFDSPTCPLEGAIKSYYKNLLSGKTPAKQRELAGRKPFRFDRRGGKWEDAWTDLLKEDYTVVPTPLSILIYIKWADDTSPM